MWVPAALTGSAVCLWFAPRSAVLRGMPRPGRVPGARPRPRRAAASLPARRLVAYGAGISAALLVGGAPGLVVGVFTAVLCSRLLLRLGTRADLRRTAALQRDLPLAADLLAAVLGAGAPPAVAAASVGRALGGPLGHELERVARASDLGAAPAAAWAHVLEEPATTALARPLLRAADRGAPAAAAAARIAAEQRREARDRAAAAAEVVAVRGVGPLGLCFLPAFVLLGVLPLVAGSALALLRG